jgi:hypothetical protein
MRMTTFCKILGSALILLVQFSLIRHVDAQEPPFWFDLIPSYESGQITYQLAFYSRVDWPMPDLTINVSLPEGTRFVEGYAQPGVTVTPTGQEVIFFTSSFNKYFEEAGFVVEIIDPSKTIFSAPATISWKGNHQGTYPMDAVTIDITRPTLDWEQPGPSRLQVGASATISGSVVTYELYPKAVGEERMWDLNINVSLPPGVEILTANAPPPFNTTFSGKDIEFSLLELERHNETEPLTIRIDTSNMITPVISAQVWASWTNAVHPVAEIVAPTHEQIMIDISLPISDWAQQDVFDTIGDVPFDYYDLRSIVFKEDASRLLVTFNTSGSVDQAPGRFLEYTLFIDTDCDSSTGQPVKHRGADYRVYYDHQKSTAAFVPWDTVASDWNWDRWTGLDSFAAQEQLIMGVPFTLMELGDHFCWIARSMDRTETFNQPLPVDWLPNEEFLRLTRYQRAAGITESTSGMLAVPLANYLGNYDVHIFSLPTGEETDVIYNARQVDFRPDGRYVLVSHEDSTIKREVDHELGDGTVLVLKNPYALEGGFYEYDLIEEVQNPINVSATASYPFYDPVGDRFLYATTELESRSDAVSTYHRLTQCELVETEKSGPDCVDTLLFVSDPKSERVSGSYPVWVAENTVAFRSCNAASCGIHLSEGILDETAVTTQITFDDTDIPSDAKGDYIAFTSQRDGDWEAYVMRLDGGEPRNVSGSPSSNDGLPTISPDGNHVAFVSDRDGAWSVWATSLEGGLPRKLFELPTTTPWGNDEQSWVTNRISWGF